MFYPEHARAQEWEWEWEWVWEKTIEGAGTIHPYISTDYCLSRCLSNPLSSTDGGRQPNFFRGEIETLNDLIISLCPSLERG